MIHEYAIDPELVVAWGKDRSDYRYFIEQFGLGTSRIMAEFPKFKNWRKQFKHAAASADKTNELPRITAIYNLLKERLIHRDGFNYDGALSWLENAESENTRQEFHAILAQINPRHHAKVLASAEVETSPLWPVEKQMYCPRKPTHMAQLLTGILTNCSHIHFIDPYFSPDKPQCLRPLEAFLDVIVSKRACRPDVEKIIIHTSGKQEINFFKQSCENKLKPRIPVSICLIIQRWNERGGGEKFHNRYILTDIGGVKVDPGLDDGNEGENFEVLLLARNLYEKQWNDFVANPAFDLAEQQITLAYDA